MTLLCWILISSLCTFDCRAVRKDDRKVLEANDNEQPSSSRPKLNPNIEQFKKAQYPPKDATVKKLVHTVSVKLSDVNVENQYTKLAEVVNPLWEMPYDEQLQYKHKKLMEVFRVIGTSLKNAGCKVQFTAKGLPCKVEKVRPSPVQEQYRNKDEFSVHNGINGDPKTVGFFIGRPGHEGVLCVPGDHVVVIKDSHKMVAKHFQDYIQMSPLPACHRFNEGGFWRNIRVRSNLAGDLMGIVIVHPQQMSRVSASTYNLYI